MNEQLEQELVLGPVEVLGTLMTNKVMIVRIPAITPKISLSWNLVLCCALISDFKARKSSESSN